METIDLMDPLFWNSGESYCSLNPQLDSETKEKILHGVEEFQKLSSLWVKSSGTESFRNGRHKIVCIEKKAFLSAARSVVNEYGINGNDYILNPLPLFHVGGIATYARSYISGARITDLKGWSPVDFFSKVQMENITVTSLVPTQVFDLVEKKLKAPESLRLVFVGGGALAEDLYKESRSLGWPLIPTYGMTETSAMLAGAELKSLKDSAFPRMKIMDHIQWMEKEGRHAIRSEALFKGYLFVGSNECEWKERKDPFFLDDKVEVNFPYIKVLGRETELIKILGETVNLVELAQKYKRILSLKKDPVLKAYKNPRKGYDLKLFVEGEPEVLNMELVKEKFMGFERVSEILFLKNFPKNEMGKVLKNQLN